MNNENFQNVWTIIFLVKLLRTFWFNLSSSFIWENCSCIENLLSWKQLYTKYKLYTKLCKKYKKKVSSWPATGLRNRGPLKDLNDSKLIVYESKWFLWSSRINFIPFRIFWGPLFHKPVTRQETLFCCFLQQTGSSAKVLQISSRGRVKSFDYVSSIFLSWLANMHA